MGICYQSCAKVEKFLSSLFLFTVLFLFGLFCLFWFGLFVNVGYWSNGWRIVAGGTELKAFT